MSCISHICSSAAAFVYRNPRFLTRGCSVVSFSSTAWKGSMWRASVRAIVVDLRLPVRLGVRCYAAARRARGAAAGAKSKEKEVPLVQAMEDNAFYVVRKGDMIAVYKSLSDCQAQVSSSVCDPSVSVFKGYSLQKETEEYLVSRGLRNPLYCIHANDCKEDLFGNLLPCPFQEPDGRSAADDKVLKKASTLKRLKDATESGSGLGLHGHYVDSATISSKQLKKASSSCIIEFDGASKGNPGIAGAGVVVKAEDGTVISRLREGIGTATNNVAEYRAVLLGMKYALRNGYQKIFVQGDSLLVCNQIQGIWQIKEKRLIELCKEAKELKDKFLSFQICHVKREFNAGADEQANLAITLPDGEVYVESGIGV